MTKWNNQSLQKECVENFGSELLLSELKWSKAELLANFHRIYMEPLGLHKNGEEMAKVREIAREDAILRMLGIVDNNWQFLDDKLKFINFYFYRYYFNII